MTSEADDGSTSDDATAEDGSTTEGAETHVFDLQCTDCSFETTVEGDCFDAIDVAEAHQEEHGVGPTDHAVNFERRE